MDSKGAQDLTRSIGVPEADMARVTAEILRIKMGQSPRLSSPKPSTRVARAADDSGIERSVSTRRPENGDQSGGGAFAPRPCHSAICARRFQVTLAANRRGRIGIRQPVRSTLATEMRCF